MKKCTSCNVEKDLDLFPKVGAVCKECKAKKLREYRENNKEHVRALRKKHRLANREKINAQKRNSYRSNPEAIKKKNNKYYHNNAEKCKNRQRKYQVSIETATVESWLAKCMKYSKASDKKLGREFDLDLQFLNSLYDKQNGRCAVSNVAMTHNRSDLFAISIDRINSNRGKTDHMPLRILHANDYIAGMISFRDKIELNARPQAGANSSFEYLLVL